VRRKGNIGFMILRSQLCPDAVRETHTLYDERIAKEVQRKNDTLKEIFNRLKKENEKNIIFISSKNMLGEDGEATVDGIHFTDLGMMRYADLVCPIIKKAIK
ncbi:SGNH/GDSL hydrolase family protein, partial [Bacteroides xylanisolvens]|uniref:SGNH/GDSL hydrolase family protein n=1 Tax=Bacteroides xylanisolvens TaxID=371601 RepID=UPI0039B5D711